MKYSYLVIPLFVCILLIVLIFALNLWSILGVLNKTTYGEQYLENPGFNNCSVKALGAINPPLLYNNKFDCDGEIVLDFSNSSNITLAYNIISSDINFSNSLKVIVANNLIEEKLDIIDSKLVVVDSQYINESVSIKGEEEFVYEKLLSKGLPIDSEPMFRLSNETPKLEPLLRMNPPKT